MTGRDTQMSGSGKGEKNPDLPWTTADPPAASEHEGWTRRQRGAQYIQMKTEAKT